MCATWSSARRISARRSNNYCARTSHIGYRSREGPEDGDPTLVGGRYVYTRDLLAIMACRPASRPRLPMRLREVTTPLRTDRWEQYLRLHPDREFVDLLLGGLRKGFRVGFVYAQSSCRRAKSNMHSADENPRVVDDYLAGECKLGRVVGPLSAADVTESTPIHTSRFGVITEGAPDRKVAADSGPVGPQRGKRERRHSARAVLTHVRVRGRRGSSRAAVGPGMYNCQARYQERLPHSACAPR